jgi:DNA-binding transcriptional MerR regulator
MLKIGEFSALTGISIHMLRNYDKIGLLKPEQVDGMTGYRFYGERQIVRANHIQVLKDLGFGLKEISEILIGDTLDDRVRTFLESKICEKEESLLTAQKQIVQMRQALKELDEAQNVCTLSVSIRRLPNIQGCQPARLSGNSPKRTAVERLDSLQNERGPARRISHTAWRYAQLEDVEKNAIDTEVYGSANRPDGQQGAKVFGNTRNRRGRRGIPGQIQPDRRHQPLHLPLDHGERLQNIRQGIQYLLRLPREGIKPGELYHRNLLPN